MFYTTYGRATLAGADARYFLRCTRGWAALAGANGQPQLVRVEAAAGEGVGPRQRRVCGVQRPWGHSGS
jgi:hypothetical protein